MKKHNDKTKTKVVNVYKKKYDIYIGRDTKGRGADEVEIGEKGWLGNPFKVKDYSREESIKLFKDYFYDRINNDKEFKDAVDSLKGKKLGCFCKPKSCHGDVIVEYLEREA